MAEADPRLGRAGSLETLSTLRAGSTLAAASSLPPAEALELGRAGVDDVRPRSLPGYEILEELGHGSTGFVFRARQANLERDVAVKTSRSIAASDPDHRLRFLSEALVTGSLDHPNVVPTHDLVFDQEGRPSLAMKLIGGLTWDALLHPKSDAERERARDYGFERHLEVLQAVCNAVAFAHSRGIIHRDLKPSNVMVGDFGEVLVTDWGLAVDVADESDASARWRAPLRSRVTDPEGTPAYMAPEMAAGRGDALCLGSDVYLLGAILFELATGAPPHLDDSVASALTAACRGEHPPYPPSVPPELRDLCEKAMAANPADRFADASDFQRALREFSSHRQSLAIADDAATRLAAALQRAATELTPEGRAEVYLDLREAASGFHQAQLLWPENERAVDGERETRIANSRIALENGDLALAISLLRGLSGPDVDSLCHEIDAAREAREGEARRTATLRRSVFVIGVFALALLLTAAFLFRSMHAIGNRIADQMGELLTAEARDSLQHAVEDGVRRLAKDRSRGEIALYIYAREIEAKLAAPPPDAVPPGPPLWASDIDAGRVDAARLVELPRYDRVEGGHRVPSPISLEDQSFFAPPGANESRVRDDVARLRSLVPTVRWLYEENPELARFFAALGDTALYVQYPGSGQLPRGYDPTKRGWYRTALAHDGIEITGAYRDATTQQLVMSLVTQLRHAGRTVGVAGADFDVDQLLDSRRPDESWHDHVLVSLLKVRHEPELQILAALGHVPGVKEEVGREPGNEPDITPRDPVARQALERAITAKPPQVLQTKDERGDWLWAFEPLPLAGDLVFTMAAPTKEVTAAADAIDDGIRVEAGDQLRRTAAYAAIGLAGVLILLALWTYYEMRSSRPREPPRRTT